MLKSRHIYTTVTKVRVRLKAVPSLQKLIKSLTCPVSSPAELVEPVTELVEPVTELVEVTAINKTLNF